MNRRLPLALAGLTLLGLLAASLLPDAPRETPPVRPAASRAPVRPALALPAPLPPRAPAPAKAMRTRYRLSYEQRASFGGEQRAGAVVEGLWTLTERGDGQVEAQLAAERLLLQGAPSPALSLVADPIQWTRREGRLTGMAFPEQMPREARAVLTGLATTFQFTPGDGEAWTVKEEDMQGTYEARYARTPEGFSRTRGGYFTLRGAQGMDNVGQAARVQERSTFALDAQGLRSAEVDLTLDLALGGGAPDIRMTVRGTLLRLEAGAVEVAQWESLEAGPISDHIDHAALKQQRDRGLVNGATTRTLLAEVRQAALIPRQAPDAQKHRSVALRRLAAGLRLDPLAAAEVAELLRRESGDPSLTGLLAGALASAGHPESTNALAGLLSERLPESTRSALLGNLALTRTPTEQSVAALTQALDAPLGDQATLALGSEAKTLGAESSVAQSAVDVLLERYANARTAPERRLLLQALANSGHPKALPVMRQHIAGQDLELANLATYGLRFMPGEEVDSLLLQLIQSGSPLALEAIRATAFRLPSFWRPQLERVQLLHASNQRVVDAVRAVLARWPQFAPEVP
jgi:hypothetical protein